MFKKVLTTAVAASALVATPVLAQEQSVDRLPAPIEAEAEGMADGNGLLFGLAALALIVAAIIIAAGGDEQDLPTSP